MGCPHPPFSVQLKGVYVGLAVASASPSLQTLRDLDPSTFPLLKGATDTWSQLGARVGARGPSSLFSLIAAFKADYSPLTQTVLLLPGKVPVPPRGATWGPQGWGEHRMSEWASVECSSRGNSWGPPPNRGRQQDTRPARKQGWGPGRW